MANKRNLLIIIIFVLIGAIIGGVYYLWLPKYYENESKKKQLETLSEKIKKREDYLKRINDLSKNLSDYQEEISKIEIALPEDFSVAALFEFLMKASSESGLIIQKTDVGKLYTIKPNDSSDTSVKKLPFSVLLRGFYPSLKNFLFSVYRNNRIIEVKSIKFSLPPKEESTFKGISNLFDFELGLETYYFQPKVKSEELTDKNGSQ